MSLKLFHIVFISFSVLFAFGFGIWLLDAFTRSGATVMLMAAIASFLSGVGLVVYGVRFLRKLRHIRFL